MARVVGRRGELPFTSFENIGFKWMHIHILQAICSTMEHHGFLNLVKNSEIFIVMESSLWTRLDTGHLVFTCKCIECCPFKQPIFPCNVQGIAGLWKHHPQHAMFVFIIQLDSWREPLSVFLVANCTTCSRNRAFVLNELKCEAGSKIASYRPILTGLKVMFEKKAVHWWPKLTAHVQFQNNNNFAWLKFRWYKTFIYISCVCNHSNW